MRSLEGEIQILRRTRRSTSTPSTWAPPPSAPASTCPKATPRKVAAHLAKLTGKPIVPATDMLAATWDQQGFVVYSSALKSVAIKLSKISSDLILLDVRAARGLGGNQSAGAAAGLLDHAGQGESRSFPRW